MMVFGWVSEVSRCQRLVVMQVAGWVSMCLVGQRYFDWVGCSLLVLLNWNLIELSLLLRMALRSVDLPGLRDLGGLKELLSLAKCVPLALKSLQMQGCRRFGVIHFVVGLDLVG